MVDITSMCYLCLCSNKTKHEFSSDEEYTHILERVNYVLPELMILEVSVNISTRICTECVTSVNAFYNFKNKCLCNNADVLNDLQNENEQIESSTQIFANTVSNDTTNDLLSTSTDKELIVDQNVVLLLDDNIGLKEEIVESEDVLQFSDNVTIEDIDKYEGSSTNEENHVSSNTKEYDIKNVTNLEEIENGITYYICSICSKRYKTKSNLKYHLNIHAGIFKYICSVCDKKFVQKRFLQQHIACVHEKKYYQCQYCGKVYKSNNNYVNHLMQHAGFQRFTCHTCGKQFLNKNNLNVHMVLHAGKKFECSICNKLFAVKRYLKAHEKLHKDVFCTFCNEKFYQKSKLNQHERRCTAKINFIEYQI